MVIWDKKNRQNPNSPPQFQIFSDTGNYLNHEGLPRSFETRILQLKLALTPPLPLYLLTNFFVDIRKLLKHRMVPLRYALWDKVFLTKNTVIPFRAWKFSRPRNFPNTEWFPNENFALARQNFPTKN